MFFFQVSALCFCIRPKLVQALRREEASESQSMADFLRNLVMTTLTDKVLVPIRYSYRQGTLINKVLRYS